MKKIIKLATISSSLLVINAVALISCSKQKNINNKFLSLIENKNIKNYKNIELSEEIKLQTGQKTTNKSILMPSNLQSNFQINNFRNEVELSSTLFYSAFNSKSSSKSVNFLSLLLNLDTKFIAGLTTLGTALGGVIVGGGTVLYNKIWWDTTVNNFLRKLNELAGDKDKKSKSVDEVFSNDQKNATRKLLKAAWDLNDSKLRDLIKKFHDNKENNLTKEFKDNNAINKGSDTPNVTNNIFAWFLYGDKSNISTFFEILFETPNKSLSILIYDFFNLFNNANIKEQITYKYEIKNNENIAISTKLEKLSDIFISFYKYYNFSIELRKLWTFFITLAHIFNKQKIWEKLRSLVETFITSIINVFVKADNESYIYNSNFEDEIKFVNENLLSKHNLKVDQLPHLFLIDLWNENRFLYNQLEKIRIKENIIYYIKKMSTK
ncbi:hypothetical protein [Mycoplasma phocimorsus]|uniref:hypothetical protein n=1 Tax=Mycoplasma phocimorsus TaxID=3045839 RepID=UPI0024C09F31|nr:hypothetical protein [Mycoplasma phocimorsus]MDJ1648112.1 hypothetical protein [Mycoplasma phocimorsus]